MPKSPTPVFAHGLINVAILVDTAAIIANPNVGASGVIFMVDDNQSGGSTGEGSFELNTACSPGDTIIWRMYAINASDEVDFVAFKNSNGDVFGFLPPHGTSSQYQATASNTGQETYQILIRINNVVQYSWDPFVTCT
jgi:hypothetical protein